MNNKVYIDGLTQLINTNTFYAPLSVGGDAEKGNSWYINGVEQDLPLINYDYYVHPDGDDENDGLRPVTAFRTLEKALEVVGPDDTILVITADPPGSQFGNGYGSNIFVPGIFLPPIDLTFFEETPDTLPPAPVEVPFIVLTSETQVTEGFINEGDAADLTAVLQAYEAALQSFEERRDNLTDEQINLYELDQALALAAILALELALETDEADLDAAVEAYLAAMELLEEHGGMLSEEQLEAVTELLEAVAAVLIALGADLTA